MIQTTQHAYRADPQSGAGNCVCGASENHRRHPHRFTEAWIWAQRVGPVLCVCGLPADSTAHFVGDPA